MALSPVDEAVTLPRIGKEHIRFLNTLVIVDNLPMLGIFRSVLADLGLKNVRHGRNAQEVVSILMTEPIDLVVIDDHAPLDGVKFLKTLRRGSNRLPNALPVIFITALAERERIVAARDAGANEILIKPFTPLQLKTRLENSLLKPREFVEAPAYVGPDRRRRRADGSPHDRRADDHGSDRRDDTETDPRG